jgi:hypothetical protein
MLAEIADTIGKADPLSVNFRFRQDVQDSRKNSFNISWYILRMK